MLSAPTKARNAEMFPIRLEIELANFAIAIK